MRVLVPLAAGVPLAIPVQLRQRYGWDSAVFCVSVPPVCLLTAVSQIAEIHDALVVGCCRQLPAGSLRSCMYWHKKSRMAVNAVVTVSAHCLRGEEQCNKLLSHVGLDSLLIHVIPTGTTLPRHLTAMKVLNIFLEPRRLLQLPTRLSAPPNAIYGNRAVELYIVGSHTEAQIEEPRAPTTEDHVVLFITEEKGPTVPFFPGLMVRAGNSRQLARIGVSPGLPGIIEAFTSHELPIVRFANGVVVVVALSDPVRTKKDPDNNVCLMPLSPATRVVPIRDIQETSKLAPNWTITVDPNCNSNAVRHLLS